jgi:hypothetical protein
MCVKKKKRKRKKERKKKKNQRKKEKKITRAGTEHYFKWIEGFTTWKKRIGINLIHVTVGK